MKYLFGSDLAAEEEIVLSEQRKFLKAELPEPMQEELDRREEALEDLREKAGLPKLLKCLKWILLVPGALCAMGILRAAVSLAEGYRNAPWAYWIAGVGLAAGGLLALADKLMSRKGEQSEAVRDADRAKGEAERSADALLGIPADARKTDVLIFSYKNRNGRMKVQGPALNGELRIYRQGEDLCLTEGTEVHAIPLKSITGLRLVPGAMAFLGWNKGDKPDQEKYKQAGLTLQRGEPAGLKFCCALEWTDGGETWQLLFPAYERSKFERLTGLKAPDLPDRKRKPEQGSLEALERRYDGKVRPRFYWTVPKEENAGFWFSPLSDEAFKAEHPRLYVFLTVVGILLLVLPMAVFITLQIALRPQVNSPWLLLGVVGGFVTGIGLINLAAAWMEQYLGHWVTILCVAAGGAMMAAAWLLAV